VTTFLYSLAYSFFMALFIVGMGLCPPGSISKEGLELIKKAGRVYMELYTNSLSISPLSLGKEINKKVEILSREILEETSRLELESAKQDVVLLVTGDTLFATTHIELVMRLEKAGVPVRVIPNASVVNAVLFTGLQGYKFGRIVSLPHPSPALPKSSYIYIQKNKSIGLHTLILLDVEREGRPAMTIAKAVDALLDMGKMFKKGRLSSDDKWLGCSRLGSKAQIIKYATPDRLKTLDFGGVPHCLIIPGELHFLEEEALERFE
jgi:diphthine synthase